eukprot:scaffold5479_cov199-Amphora_coffeaeformis.AAC.79
MEIVDSRLDDKDHVEQSEEHVDTVITGMSDSEIDKIDGKDVVLLIGGTNLDLTHTTTTHYLCGTKCEEEEIAGWEHYKPISFVNRDLADFVTTGGSKSVTKTLNATTIRLDDGESVTICDTPGFCDSSGAEMDISNGLGISSKLEDCVGFEPSNDGIESLFRTT